MTDLEYRIYVILGGTESTQDWLILMNFHYQACQLYHPQKVLR